MRYDIHFRSDVIKKIEDVVEDIYTWNVDDTSAGDEIDSLAEYVVPFDHCVKPDRPFVVAGADGSGDFPCVTYGDSVVYLVTAMARAYEAASFGKLTEMKVTSADLVDFMWLPADKDKARGRYFDFFERLVDMPLDEICQKSDYYDLAKAHGSRLPSPVDLIDTLICPEAHDADNIGIQLLSTAEAGSLIRLMKRADAMDLEGKPLYILEDTTLALPMVTAKSTLFLEIAKRYACVLARKKGFRYLTISKSHNMPNMDLIEDMVKKKVPSGEHWFMRIPATSNGEKKPQFLGTRSFPPIGAISYLFKFHRTTQPMRLDMDFQYWKENIWCDDKEEMQKREVQMFRDLDFASHDQRCYGYPYPVKACHDMVSLTNDERVALRKQIIDAAVRAGLKRKNFVDPSVLTGHK